MYTCLYIVVTAWELWGFRCVNLLSAHEGNRSE